MAGAHPSRLGVKMGLHSGQVTNSLQSQWEKPPSTIAFPPWTNLELPVSLTLMPSDCGRKPEYLERSHADTRRTRRLHTGGSDSNPWPSYSIRTTAQSCHPNLISSYQRYFESKYSNKSFVKKKKKVTSKCIKQRKPQGAKILPALKSPQSIANACK